MSVTHRNHDREIPESVLRELERDQKAFATRKRLQPVGYWRDSKDEKTETLPEPHGLVDRYWDPAERKRVIKYLRAGRESVAYKGSSSCRFNCGASNRQMGYRDLTDGEFVWPEGFAHYVEAHAVKPPAEFLVHIRRKLAERPASPLRLLARIFRR